MLKVLLNFFCCRLQLPDFTVSSDEDGAGFLKKTFSSLDSTTLGPVTQFITVVGCFCPFRLTPALLPRIVLHSSPSEVGSKTPTQSRQGQYISWPLALNITVVMMIVFIAPVIAFVMMLGRI